MQCMVVEVGYDHELGRASSRANQLSDDVKQPSPETHDWNATEASPLNAPDPSGTKGFDIRRRRRLKPREPRKMPAKEICWVVAKRRARSR